MTLPDLDEVLADAVPFSVDLSLAFRGVLRRTGLLLRGPAGWGEFAPFDDYGPDLAARWLAAGLEAAYVGWPEPVRDTVPVNAILAAVDPGDLAADVERAAARGMTTFKVKVSGAADDEGRLRAVRAAAGQAAAVRLDVNAQLDLAGALQVLPRLVEAAGGVEYVEQPLAELSDLAVLAERTGIPLAVDETLRLAPDPFDPGLLEVVRAVAAVAVLKVPPLGGVRAVLRLAAALDMPVVVSGAADTSVGLAAGIAAAAALPSPPRACGLGTGLLLRTDVVAEPIVPRDGRLGVVSVHPDPAALARASSGLPAEQVRQWRSRLSEAWHAGAPDLVQRP